MKKFLAFTLGEVLIALGVIGVVATLILPQLISGHKASIAQSQFNTAYAMLSQAIDSMEADRVSIMPAKYAGKLNSFYPIAKNYFKIIEDCGVLSDTTENKQSACPKKSNTYTEYNSNSNHAASIIGSVVKSTSFVTNNGMLVIITNDDSIYKTQLFISVDINGANKLPNKLGWDLFSFELTNQGLLPVGAPGTYLGSETNREKYCKKDDSSTLMNGWTCGEKALTSTDYFKDLYHGH
ncbi:hypothetical protein IJ541_04845 [bacterium]|nr:hypothetical protein [bacterium]